MKTVYTRQTYQTNVDATNLRVCETGFTASSGINMWLQRHPQSD
uniref:Uncharacterized protein n=1 Tax=Anguilla anguilla TaxID=7936 RepID=A0A0E9R302_ANGAN